MNKIIQRHYDYAVVPTIAEFSKDDSFIGGLMGPFGCISGDSLVVTERGLLPIADITEPMQVLSWNEMSNQFQLSLSGSAFPKGKDYLYRVITQRGEFLAAGHHLVFCGGHEYQQVQNLSVGQTLSLCSFFPKKIFSSFSQSHGESDALHFSHINKDYRDGCGVLIHQYGGQPHVVANTCQVSAPLSAYVHKSTFLSDISSVWHTDDCQVLSQERSHLGQCACQIQTDDSCPRFVHHKKDVLDYICSTIYGHNEQIALQWKQFLSMNGSHRKEQLSGGEYLSSLSEWTILAIEKQKVKQDYWDMQVLDTNNYVTIEGAIHHNSGKSSGCVIKIGSRSKKQNPDQNGVRWTRWAVIRNTFRQLRDTSIKTFHYWLPPGLCGRWKETSCDYYMFSELSDGTKVNCEIMFRALDKPGDIDNLLSWELTGAWINEAREIPLDIVNGLQGRVGRFPPPASGGPTWAGLIMDTNPPDTDHWWYKLFEEHSLLKGETVVLKCTKCSKDYDFQPNKGICPSCGMRHMRLFRQPSGRSPNAENLKNLPINYYANLMIGKSPEFIKVYVDGEYGYVQDGKPVFPNFRDSVHVAKEDIKPILDIPLIIGFDFGLNASYVICQLTPKGQLNVIEECITENTGIRRLAREILKPVLLTKYRQWQNKIISVGDWAGNARAETDERTCFQELRDAGIPAVMARTNNMTARIQAVDSFLTRFIDGKPAFQLSPYCKILRKGFNGSYRFRRIQVAGTDIHKDVPEKNIASHGHDALQYACLEADQDIQSFERGVKSREIYQNIEAGSFVSFGGHI